MRFLPSRGVAHALCVPRSHSWERPQAWYVSHTMSSTNTVFLFDVDNTLLDNDHVTADLKRYLQNEVGPERAQHYWEFFEILRTELGYADYLGALQRYRIEYRSEEHTSELQVT